MKKEDQKNLSKIHDIEGPYLKIYSPSAQEFKINIEKKRITIGRLAESNDVCLSPDPQKFITRYMHCAVESEAGYFYAVDNASKNGTFLRHFGKVNQIRGRSKLESGDTILILASFAKGGEPEYWEIIFIDPQATEKAIMSEDVPHLEYDWVQAKLYLIANKKRQEIRGLRPQEHRLIRYMDQRNQKNDNVPVMCTYEEIFEAIWDEQSEFHTKNDISRLVWELRQKIEKTPQERIFLQTIRGMGYRLITVPAIGSTINW